jgi:hypothetical protein
MRNSIGNKNLALLNDRCGSANEYTEDSYFATIGGGTIMHTLGFSLLLVSAAIGGGVKTPPRWNFEDTAVGELPADWTATKTGEGEGSVWKVREDKTAPNGPKVLAQTSPDGPNPMFNLCVHNKFSAVDLDLSIAFRAIAGKKDQGGGPVWRFQDPKNYYIARMNPLEDNFRLYKVVDGKRIQLATADVTVDVRKWHTIRVVQRGEQIQCFLNGKKLLEAKDNAIQNAGKIGLWTKADAQTYFDNIVVRRPE